MMTRLNQQKIYTLHGNQTGKFEGFHYALSENGIDYGVFSYSSGDIDIVIDNFLHFCWVTFFLKFRSTVSHI